MSTIPDVIEQAENLLKEIYSINNQIGSFVKQDEIFQKINIEQNQEKIKETHFLLKDVLISSWQFLEVAQNGTK